MINYHIAAVPISAILNSDSCILPRRGCGARGGAMNGAIVNDRRTHAGRLRIGPEYLENGLKSRWLDHQIPRNLREPAALALDSKNRATLPRQGHSSVVPSDCSSHRPLHSLRVSTLITPRMRSSTSPCLMVYRRWPVNPFLQASWQQDCRDQNTFPNSCLPRAPWQLA